MQIKLNKKYKTWFYFECTCIKIDNYENSRYFWRCHKIKIKILQVHLKKTFKIDAASTYRRLRHKSSCSSLIFTFINSVIRLNLYFPFFLTSSGTTEIRSILSPSSWQRPARKWELRSKVWKE